VLVPLAEAWSERAPGPVQVEAVHSPGCARVHQPATCVSCQVAAARARTAARARIPDAATVRVAPESRTGFLPATLLSSGVSHSRAPPASPA
jgi:hypothetical protein